MPVAATIAIRAAIDSVMVRGGRRMHARFNDRPARGVNLCIGTSRLGLLNVDRRMQMAGMRQRARRRERNQRQHSKRCK